jgi:hypothetical protein
MGQGPGHLERIDGERELNSAIWKPGRILPRQAGFFGLTALVFCLGCSETPAPRSAASSQASARSSFHFVDVAAAAGLTRIAWAGRPGKDHLLDSAGTGVAFLDFDRDGRLDLYFVNGWRMEGSRILERGRNALYRGLPDGTFADVTGEAGVDGEGHWGSGVAVADYDADGWPDLFITNFGPNLLYRNRGDGTFENVAAAVGVESPGWNTGAAFFDAEGDGDLDLYVASYIDCTLQEFLEAEPTLDWKGLEKVALGPFGLEGAPDHFFRSEGGARFVEATTESGLEDRALGYGFGVTAADYDDDGDIDIYVANDSDPNYYYRNEGDGRFREIGAWAGSALDGNGAAQAGMGIAVGDVTGDGLLDILVTNFAEDFTTFYSGLGGGLFEDASGELGVGTATFQVLSWGTAFADFDNDGDLDLVIVNGHIYPQIDRHPDIVGTFAQRNLLLENRQGKFFDITEDAGPGFQLVQSSRGLAVGDYDNDGDPDLLISNQDAPPNLLRNDTPGGAWLTVELEVPDGEPTPLGTRVTVTVNGRNLRRDLVAATSHMSSHDPRLHFGLGEAVNVEEIDVKWPDGTHSIRTNVPVNRFVRIQKGS